MRLTKFMLNNSRVIAKGNRIRKLDELMKRYGGERAKWTKKSSPKFEHEGNMCEYHWYEHHGIGRFEIKLKNLDK